MGRSWHLFIIWLVLLPTASARAQDVAQGDSVSGRPFSVSFGVRGGFTSSLLRASQFSINEMEVDEVQNYYKIGYFASLFMRINLNRHFLQPEVAYSITRCDITFQKPNALEGDMSSIQSSLHSIDIPLLYGYNIIKEPPYSLAVFGGPKLRYIWSKKSNITFVNFDQPDMRETLYPLNLSLTLGVNVSISHIFFDFRYDIGLRNISKLVTYTPYLIGNETDVSRISLQRTENVLSFSLGVLF